MHDRSAAHPLGQAKWDAAVQDDRDQATGPLIKKDSLGGSVSKRVRVPNLTL